MLLLQQVQIVTDAYGSLKDNLSMGSIDVNIMTKVDKKNYFKKEELPS